MLQASYSATRLREHKEDAGIDVQKNRRGGARPGAGRKPGQRSPRKKIARQVTLPQPLWARIDAAQSDMGLTRTSIFEEMATAWLDHLVESKEEQN